jgi:hypothetical protein
MDISPAADRLKTLGQRLRVPLSEPELQAILGDLLTLLEDQLTGYESLTATLNGQTITLMEQTETINRLVAEREHLLTLMHGRMSSGPLVLCQACGAAME